ncbi:related to ribosomal protein YmS18, mitochondrial [Sporisorium scitamineum]|uniref:Related to ribosomal protein YmS18, mitochondrial n=1 Tax=Sporisorium scitamineum TaxID=49012 RepID=A0A0F7RZW6_9BASI|nr:related to ribosomal protein YmS18, mitochondrial [Sporisorium scitamineum]CDS02130.1 hypothetical protein [Sporisorium scitamineum]
MLRGLTRHLTSTALRTTIASEPSSICQQYRPSSTALRSFSTSRSTLNDSDKSASTQSLESSSSGQPTSDPTSAGSSNVSEALQRDLSSTADTSTTGRQAAPTNLDDLLGSISAVSTLPGSETPPTSETSFKDRTPIIRSSFSSRYLPFSATSTLPHRLFINSSRNNTILTLTSPSGDPLASASGGSVGFKKSARSGYEAGYRAAFSMFGKINEFKGAWRIQHLEVLWNGFGQGREAVFRALLAGEGQLTKGLISKMTDKTPVKIGGVRPKKRRML